SRWITSPVVPGPVVPWDEADRLVSDRPPVGTLDGPGDDRASMRGEAMKILLAYDGDPSAQRALETAARMATAFDATIYVLSVVPLRAGRAPMDPWDDRDVHELELQDAVKRLAMLGLTCTTIESAGAVAPEIERIARDGGYDLVVVGSRGLGTLDRL